MTAACGLPAITPRPVSQWKVWQVPIGLLVSGAFLYLAGHNLDWELFRANLAQVTPSRLALAALLSASAYVLRGFRWRLFFHRDEAPSWWTSERILLIGYAANNILPARAGEVLRAHYLGDGIGLSRTRVLATVVLERAFDVLTLLVFLLVALPVVGRRIPHLEGAAWLAAVIVLVVLGLFALWHWRGRHLAAGTTVSPVRPGLLGKVLGRADQFLQGLEGLGSRMALLRIAALSLSVWLLDGLSFWTTMQAFPQVCVPWDAALAVVVFGNIGTMIPAGPAAAGTFEFSVVQVLKPWGFDPALSMGMAVVIHLVQFLLTTSTGLLAWLSIVSVGRMGWGRRHPVPPA